MGVHMVGHYRGSHTRTERVCTVCGRTFWNEAKVPAKYCSTRCSWKVRGVPVEDRFWSKVNKNGSVPEHNPELGPCWVWTGRRDKDGYGWFWYQREAVHATRVAWILTHGAPPDGWVLHYCDYKPCVRPSHLHPGDALLNSQEARARIPAWALQGEARPDARLTNAIVQSLRQRLADGTLHVSKAAVEFGVHRSVISRAAHGKRWRHLP
jgi:hypothetical protein